MLDLRHHEGQLQIARALGISRTVVAQTPKPFGPAAFSTAQWRRCPTASFQKSLGHEKVPQDGSRYAELTALSPRDGHRAEEEGGDPPVVVGDVHRRTPQRLSRQPVLAALPTLAQKQEISMHIEYKAGEAMLVDWAETSWR